IEANGEQAHNDVVDLDGERLRVDREVQMHVCLEQKSPRRAVRATRTALNGSRCGRHEGAPDR
ncbi:hypothetical protein, partial [Burkholderia pseudomallei]|uniref:hypothetical protein n=1 Tax=Burkholderia pseudomallei TaxID=28450 RepID=UPI0013922C2E